MVPKNILGFVFSILVLPVFLKVGLGPRSPGLPLIQSRVDSQTQVPPAVAELKGCWSFKTLESEINVDPRTGLSVERRIEFVVELTDRPSENSTETPSFEVKPIGWEETGQRGYWTPYRGDQALTITWPLGDGESFGILSVGESEIDFLGGAGVQVGSGSPRLHTGIEGRRLEICPDQQV
jgi:hypothetical protein